MATGVTSSITSNVAYTSRFELKGDGDDILNIIGATVTLNAPQGEIFTGKGDDTVLVDNSTIVAKADDLCFYLGDGNDTLTIRNSIISVPLNTDAGPQTEEGDGNDILHINNSTISKSIEMESGDDYVSIEGSIQTQTKLNGSLSFGNGNDTLELIAMLQNAGGIDFGNGTDRLLFNGGALLGSGAVSSFEELEVTLSGGTTGSNLTLSGEQTGITLKGNLIGTTQDKTIAITGGTTTFTVGNNIRTNVRFNLTDNTLIQADDGTLEISDHTGIAFTGSNSDVTLHDIVIDGSAGIWSEKGSTWTITNSTFSNSDNIAPVVLKEKSKMTGAQLAFSSNRYKGAISLQDASTIDVTGFRAIGNGKGRTTSVKVSGSNPAVARTTAFFGAAIEQSGGSMNLTSASFSGNITSAIAYASSFRYASAYVSAFGGAIYQENGNITLTSASFSGNMVSASATAHGYYASVNYSTAGVIASATAFGGAVYQNSGIMNLVGASFSGNRALARTWGVVAANANARSEECASAYGGAIYQNNGYDMILTSAVFSGNIASSYTYGQAIKGTADAQHSASAFGGAIYQNGGQMTLNGAVFSGNVANAHASASMSNVTSKTSATVSADAFGGAVYLLGTIVNMEDTVFSSNVASATASANTGKTTAAARGGAIYINNATLNYAVTSGKTLSNVGNKAVASAGNTAYSLGGWLYAVTKAIVNITVGNDAALIIGEGSKYTDRSNKDDSIAGKTDCIITKNGTGLLQINSDVLDYEGKWIINEGTVYLRRIVQTISLDNWTIGTAAELRLSEEQDTINMEQSKKVGLIDFGGGSDILNMNGYDLTDGKLLISTLTINDGNKGGRVSAQLTNRRNTAGNTITLNGVVLDSDFTGNQYVDTFTIGKESTIGGKLDLGGGNDVITATAKTTFIKTLQTGSGNDTLTFTVVEFEDAVELGDGDNSLKATSSAHFSKTLTAGSGKDTLNFAEVTFEDIVDLEDGDNSLTANGTAKFSKGLNAESGNDTLSFASVRIEDALNLGDGTNTLTATGEANLQRITGGSGDDTITLNGDSAISGEISLGTGINSIHVNKKLSETNGIQIAKDGQTTVYVYLGSTLSNNTLSVYADAEAARDTITLNWSEQTELNKVRILVSSDPASFQNEQYEFAVELYNHSKSFTLNLQQGYFIQFQAQDGNGWKQRLLDDTVAPDQVKGVTFNGKILKWDETHDNLGGNGVKHYHVEVASDASFSTILQSGTVTTPEFTLNSNAEGSLYIRVNAEDYTGNIGVWSEPFTCIIDNTPPSTPAEGNANVNGYSAALSWSASIDNGSGVSEYEYRVATDSSFGQIVSSGTTEACTVTVEQLKYGTYYWQVRAADAYGNIGAWSLNKSFATVDAIAPDTPTNLEFSIENEASLSVVWDPVSDDSLGSGLNGYEIQLATDSEFAAVVKTISVTTREATVEKLANATYYMRVCAVDNAGNKSGWTETNSFIIDKDTTPPTVTDVKADITTPTSGSVTVTAVFTDDKALASSLYKMGENGAWTAYKNGVTVSSNTTIYFKAVDTSGNESAEQSYTITNIDKTPPKKPTASANFTTPTNQDVSVYATFSEDSAVKEYSLDEQTWFSYTAPVVFDKNGTVFFRATDAVGNISEVTTYKVSNIDKVAPEKPTITANIVTVTNQDVVLSVKSSSDSVLLEYNFNDGEWKQCGTSNTVTVTMNGVLSFRSTDTAGNVSEVATYTVSNIDKTPPEKPTASADITVQTEGQVTVSAVFSDDSTVREYSLTGTNWTAYTTPVSFRENGTVYFRGTDAAGNVSAVTSFTVDNIIQPIEKPLASADITAPTNQIVTVSAVFDPKSVKNEYSVNGQVWLTYESGVSMLENGVVYFRSTSAAGSISEITSYTVKNIDKVAPEKPFVLASSSKLTNQDITVTAVFSDDSSVKEYSTNGQTWISYSEPITVSENCTILFRAQDAAGNSSGLVSFEIGNIDKIAPTTPTALKASVSGQTVTLNWTASTDDLAGVKEYVVKYSHDGQEFTVNTTATSFVIEKADYATWQWSVQAVDNVGNASIAMSGKAFTVQSAELEKPYVARGDRDGNGVSDVMFVWEQNNCAHGYWMNGAADWWSANAYGVSPDWDNLGSYDMSGDGKADAVMFGNVIVNGARGAYIGYYQNGNDMDGWVNIGYLDNAQNITWQNKVGNLTGNASGANSIVWYAPELYALGAWTDGTDSWQSISASFGGKAWTLAGCGDFNGDGRDSVLMMYNGCMFYSVGINEAAVSLGDAAWYNCEVRAVGDFSGDGKDDIVLFDKNTGGMYMLLDGNANNYQSIGQLDPTDWFIAGCGDYNADGTDDLLVRQYSTGMLGYYSNGNQANWNVMGYGVGMEWTVIA